VGKKPIEVNAHPSRKVEEGEHSAIHHSDYEAEIVQGTLPHRTRRGDDFVNKPPYCEGNKSAPRYTRSMNRVVCRPSTDGANYSECWYGNG
jgi:hypothetical protein